MFDTFWHGLLIVPILALLILVHEWGHFFAARRLGVVVEEFGLGLPPRLVRVRYRGVLYSLNALPFGGFVSLRGENGQADGPGSFASAPAWARVVILAAGVVLNAVAGFLLLAAVIGFHGEEVGAQLSALRVESDGPAAMAGMLATDHIVAVNGTTVGNMNDLHDAIQGTLDRPAHIELRRDGATVFVDATPRSQIPAGHRGALGVTVLQEPIVVRVPLARVPVAAAQETVALYGEMLGGLAGMVRGQTDVTRIAGPIGMGQATSELTVNRTSNETVLLLIRLAVVLSFNLSLLNLLPLPALDGGRIAFVALEMLRGRRVDPRVEGFVHTVGLFSLLLFMVVVGYHDIVRLVTGVALTR